MGGKATTLNPTLTVVENPSAVDRVNHRFYNAIKDAQWYSVKEGDATMIHIASWLGQKY